MKRDRIKGIKELALQMLEDAKLFIQDEARIHNESAMKEVLEQKKEDLLAYIEKNRRSELRVKIAKAVLKGENVTNNSEFVLQSLWDCTFDCGVYKDIGVNDGILITLNQLFRKLGMQRKANEACAWTYKAD